MKLLLTLSILYQNNFNGRWIIKLRHFFEAAYLSYGNMAFYRTVLSCTASGHSQDKTKIHPLKFYTHEIHDVRLRMKLGSGNRRVWLSVFPDRNASSIFWLYPFWILKSRAKFFKQHRFIPLCFRRDKLGKNSDTDRTSPIPGKPRLAFLGMRLHWFKRICQCKRFLSSSC